MKVRQFHHREWNNPLRFKGFYRPEKRFGPALGREGFMPFRPVTASLFFGEWSYERSSIFVT